MLAPALKYLRHTEKETPPSACSSSSAVGSLLLISVVDDPVFDIVRVADF